MSDGMKTQLSRETETLLRDIVDALEDNAMYAFSRPLEALCDECGGAE